MLVEALRSAEASLPAYSHACSPKTFTQHQLFACLVLKDFYNLTYRGTVAMLADCVSLTAAIGLERVPHFTTLQKAADRLLLLSSFRRLLTATVERARTRKVLRRRPRLGAMDTSGFESQHTSRYYAQRRKMTGKSGRKCRVEYHRYPKLGLVCDTHSHFILAARTSQGPQPDFGDFEPLLREAYARARLKAVAADAGFDSEANHRLARDELGIQSLIPARHGRPAQGEPTGRYRKQMKRHLAQSRYGQRWQVETVNSMLKRLSGEVVNARTYWRRCRLLLLKTLTHNISILARLIRFLLSRPVPFSSPFSSLFSSLTVWIDSAVRRREAAAAIVHEFEHVRGLTHDDGGIMSASLPDAKRALFAAFDEWDDWRSPHCRCPREPRSCCRR